MKEKEIILNSFSSEDTNRKPSSVTFEVPEVQDFESRYASEMPRRRGAAPSSLRERTKPSGKLPKKSEPKSGGKKPTSKKKKITVIILSVILLLLFIGSCKLIQFLNNPLIGETNEDILKAQDVIKDDIVTVLLVGTDGGGTNTDTIILAVMNTKAKEISLISVPRDTRVPNPYGGSGYAKINSVYAAKGMAGLISQVRDVTGMPINFYAMINFEGFREAVDILGGVKFNVPVRMKYYDPLQDLDIDLYPGMQLLDGDKAEQLVRCRSVYAQADLARTAVQRDFIIAMIEQHATLGNLPKIPDLYSAMEPYVKTSITANDAIKYGSAVVGIKSENIKSFMLPGAAGSYGASNVSYFVYDADAVEELCLEIGFKDSKVKRIPSPGKPNSGVTDAEDVDADQTIDPDDEPEKDEDEDEDEDESRDEDEGKKPSSEKPSNKDEDDKDEDDADNKLSSDKTEDDTPKPKPEPEPKPQPEPEPENDPTDYPDGI